VRQQGELEVVLIDVFHPVQRDVELRFELPLGDLCAGVKAFETIQTDVKGKREERKRKESEEGEGENWGGGLEEDIIELLVQFVLRQLHEVFNPVALLQKEVLFERSATDKNNS
jgi:hypothetical protein